MDNDQRKAEQPEEPVKHTTINRRDFLKTTASIGAVVAGAGMLAACSSPEAESKSDNTDSNAGTDTAVTPASNSSEGLTFSVTPEWLGAKPEISESEITETIETEVVIIGGGNSGLPCALTAVQEGLNVVVLETQAQETMAWYGMADISTVNSEFMISNGVPRIDPVEFLVDIQKRTQNRSDPRIIKRYIDNSGEMLDWFCEQLDPEFLATAEIPNFPDGNTAYVNSGSEIHGFKTWVACMRLFNASGENGWPVVVQKAVDLGADWRWEHTGVVLVQDGSGMVTGVIAQDSEGKYKQFNASKAVVLAAGDYGGNPDMYVSLQNEMREEWQARGYDPTGVTSAWGRDGSGIKMGMWAGGVIEPGPHCKIWPDIIFQSDNYAQNELFWGATYELGPEPADPLGTAWFTVREKDGRRFTDEGLMGMVGMGNRIEHLHEGRYFQIWDDKWAEFLPRHSMEHFMPYSTPEALELWKERLAKWYAGGPDGEQRTDGGVTTCWAADTLDELLTYMGIEEEIKANILDEIERYNGFCAKGVDEDFGKDPQLLMAIDQGPFYGQINVTEKPMRGTCALNGLNIDPEQHVLTPKGEIIPGLYATGNCSGGRFSIQYSEPSPGVSIGMAMTLGRQLAKDLAAL